jgi:hypothetical protein
MAVLTRDKLDLLKRVFIEDAMSPGPAAKKVGIAYSTAKRYYEKWGNEIKSAREQQAITQFKESLKRISKSSKRSK